MPYAYVKIALTLCIPLATLVYARQLRAAGVMQAIKWDVQHPPGLRWEIDHPREAREMSQAEAIYLRRLIWELDND